METIHVSQHVRAFNLKSAGTSFFIGALIMFMVLLMAGCVKKAKPDKCLEDPESCIKMVD